MSRFAWLDEFLAQLKEKQIVVRSRSANELAPAQLLEIDTQAWGHAGALAAEAGYRWAGTWGDHIDDEIHVFVCLEHAGDYLVLRTHVPLQTPVLASHTPYYPAADRPERHMQDLLGVAFMDHPDHRRWIRHRAWTNNNYPLRTDYPLAGTPEEVTPADGHYLFHKVQGAGVYEIPVGPVHAGIIEPGHFRFNAIGEQILSLEQHLGYTHKGVEKQAVGRTPEALVRLAGRVSGDSTVAHAWAACQALERATDCTVPERGLALRGLLCERERVANHLGDIGGICNDVGFAFANYQCSRLREHWQRRSGELFGHRLMMDVLVPGGVTVDIETTAIAQLNSDHAALRKETDKLFDILNDHPSLADRILSTGKLTHKTARSYGCTGYIGKASGQDFDVRNASPYSPYEQVPMPVQQMEEGDVSARMQVRMQEIHDSLNWMDTLLKTLSDGPVKVELPIPSEPCQGIGFVEGWRGEIITYLRLDADGLVARFFPRDPSWHHWPVLELIVMENIVPDFPVCNKSVNGSYSGHDL